MNIKKRLLWILYFAAGFILSNGTAFGETQNAFLWKLEKEDASAYILGSIHVANKQFYPLNTEIEAAFESCPVLAVEVNINEMDPLAMTGIVMEKAFYKDGDTLKNHISEEIYNVLEKKLEEFGLDLNSLNQSKPWFIAMMISNLELQKLGFDPSYGIDQHFLDLAAEEKRKVVELESFDFQIRLLEQFTDKDQELFLSYELISEETTKQGLDDLVSAWKEGDAPRMEELLYKPLTENPDFLPVYEKLFYNRNIAMAGKIEEYLKTKQCHFVVVGSGHLIGEQGIIALLKEKGYKIKQL